jgi:hypothetical protein
MVKDVISILCPTRNRPHNVVRLVNSARNLARFPELLEFLFYVDNDDFSFPDIDGVKVIRGPRVWISNSHNALYPHSNGQLLMTAGDDMEFLTKNWDVIIRNSFDSFPDKIVLVYGNDLGTHAGKIAVHGFFHRKWVDVLGTWVQPGRGSLWDLWSTDVAKSLGRLVYIPELHIKHIHYRQGLKEAEFDGTYKYVSVNNQIFRPKITYDLLARERRIDHILLSEHMSSLPPINRKYLLSTCFVRVFDSKLDLYLRQKFLLLTNLEFLILPFKLILNKIKP